MSFLRKNKTFIKYIFSAGSSFVLDLGLFTLFNYVFGIFMGYESIIVATIIARILSSLYNFMINSKYVFKQYSKGMFIKYYILVIIQMLVSSLLVYFINKYLIDTFAVIIKFVVDIILFIINYFIQKGVVFK